MYSMWFELLYKIPKHNKLPYIDIIHPHSPRIILTQITYSIPLPPPPQYLKNSTSKGHLTYESDIGWDWFSGVERDDRL